MKNNKPTDYTYPSHLNKTSLMKYNTTEVQATVSYFSDGLKFPCTNAQHICGNLKQKNTMQVVMF